MKIALCHLETSLGPEEKNIKKNDFFLAFMQCFACFLRIYI